MWSSWNSKSVLTLFKEFIHTNTLWSRSVPISLLITLLKPSSTISLSWEAWEIPNSPFMISTQALIEPPLYTDDPYAKICWIWANIWCSTKQGWNFLCLANSLKKRSSPGVEWRLTFPRLLSFFWFSKMSKYCWGIQVKFHQPADRWGSLKSWILPYDGFYTFCCLGFIFILPNFNFGNRFQYPFLHLTFNSQWLFSGLKGSK